MSKGLYVIFVLAAFSANGQIEKRDSLLNLLSFAKGDTNKVLLLQKVAGFYENTYQDSAVYYLEASRLLSDSLAYRHGLYKYHERSAVVAFTKGNYPAAMEYSNHALEMVRETGDIRGITAMLVNTAIVYQYMGYYDKQLEYLMEARKLLETVDQTDRLSSIHHNIGNSYYNLHQFRKAIQHFFISLDYYKRIGGNPYSNRIYASLGQNYAALKYADSAVYYYKIAIDESEKVKDRYAEAAIYGFMAETYADLHDFNEMLKGNFRATRCWRVRCLMLPTQIIIMAIMFRQKRISMKPWK